DSIFQTTARSARACTFYLTQNLPTLQSVSGKREEVFSLLGNLQTKILSQNTCCETSKWVNDVIGHLLTERVGQSANFANPGQSAGGSGGAGINIQRDVQLEAQDFAILANGGHAN